MNDGVQIALISSAGLVLVAIVTALSSIYTRRAVRNMSSNLTPRNGMPIAQIIEEIHVNTKHLARVFSKEHDVDGRHKGN